MTVTVLRACGAMAAGIHAALMQRCCWCDDCTMYRCVAYQPGALSAWLKLDPKTLGRHVEALRCAGYATVRQEGGRGRSPVPVVLELLAPRGIQLVDRLPLRTHPSQRDAEAIPDFTDEIRISSANPSTSRDGLRDSNPQVAARSKASKPENHDQELRLKNHGANGTPGRPSSDKSTIRALIGIKDSEFGDVEAIDARYRACVAEGVISDSEHNRLLFHGIFEHAWRVAANPAAMVVSNVREGRDHVADKDEQAAAERIQAHDTKAELAAWGAARQRRQESAREGSEFDC